MYIPLEEKNMERMNRAIQQVYNDLVIPTMRADKTSE
jgi:hypothetical protein